MIVKIIPAKRAAKRDYDLTNELVLWLANHGFIMAYLKVVRRDEMGSHYTHIAKCINTTFFKACENAQTSSLLIVQTVDYCTHCNCIQNCFNVDPVDILMPSADKFHQMAAQTLLVN